MNPIELSPSPGDVISSVRFDSHGATLLVGAWDSRVYIYRRGEDNLYSFFYSMLLDAPVLDIAWNANDKTFYVASLDFSVLELSIPEEQPVERIGADGIPTIVKEPVEKVGADDKPIRPVLSSHSKAASKVAYSKLQGRHELLLSTSWDHTLHVHDLETRKWVKITLPEKPFALCTTDTYAVVAMTERLVYIFEVQSLKRLVDEKGSKEKEQSAPEGIKPWQDRLSILKWQIRDMACTPEGEGFASTSIDGRVGVEWFDEKTEGIDGKNKERYAFKHHRGIITTTNENGEEVSMDMVYPINAVDFHPKQKQTFATGGGDGVVALWDSTTKRRIRQYPMLPSSVAAMEFSPDGRSLAVGISPGFEDGKETDEADKELVKILIRQLGENEVMRKPAKKEK